MICVVDCLEWFTIESLTFFIFVYFFFFNDTATTEIYTLSLHDALPILSGNYLPGSVAMIASSPWTAHSETPFGIIQLVRSEEHTSELQSLARISYAVFCLKKKKTNAIG